MPHKTASLNQEGKTWSQGRSLAGRDIKELAPSQGLEARLLAEFAQGADRLKGFIPPSECTPLTR